MLFSHMCHNYITSYHSNTSMMGNVIKAESICQQQKSLCLPASSSLFFLWEVRNRNPNNWTSRTACRGWTMKRGKYSSNKVLVAVNVFAVWLLFSRLLLKGARSGCVLVHFTPTIWSDKYQTGGTVAHVTSSRLGGSASAPGSLICRGPCPLVSSSPTVIDAIVQWSFHYKFPGNETATTKPCNQKLNKSVTGHKWRKVSQDPSHDMKYQYSPCSPTCWNWFSCSPHTQAFTYEENNLHLHRVACKEET